MSIASISTRPSNSTRPSMVDMRSRFIQDQHCDDESEGGCYLARFEELYGKTEDDGITCSEQAIDSHTSNKINRSATKKSISHRVDAAMRQRSENAGSSDKANAPVNRGTNGCLTSSFVAKKSQALHLGKTIASLFLWLAFVHTSVFLVIEYGIMKLHPDWNTEKQFEHFANPFWDRAVETVPFVQNWVRDSLKLDDIDRPLLPSGIASVGRPVSGAEHRCVQAFLETEFDLREMEKYPQFFHEDSVFTLSQAGQYHGPDGIAEYVRFALADSPYIDIADRKDSQLIYKGYNEETDECEFSMLGETFFKMNPITTRNNAELNMAFMGRIRFHLSKEYVKTFDLFFPHGFLEVFFGVFTDSDNTRDFICSVMTGPCEQPVEDCQEKLKALPVANGDGLYIDGNSQGCRALHAVFARNNTDHCPHISFAPMKDPKGRIKCQESMSINPKDLFDESYFEEFQLYQESLGLDPETGHDLPCEYGFGCAANDTSTRRRTATFEVIAANEGEGRNKETCIDTLYDRLQSTVPNASTSPAHVEFVLENMGLHNQPRVRHALGGLLTEPHPIQKMLNDAVGCLSKNPYIAELACIFLEKSDELWDARDSKNKHVLEYVLNQAAVYNLLTSASLDSMSLLQEVIDVMSNTKRFVVEDLIRDEFEEDEIEDTIHRYRSAALGLAAFGKSLAEDTSAENKAFLQLNILETVQVDAEHDLEANARVGLALAASVQYRSFVKENVQLWKLDEEWTAAYTAWNVASVWGSYSADSLVPHFVPFLSCGQGEDFLARTLVAQSLAIMHVPQAPVSTAGFIGSDQLGDLVDWYEVQTDDDLRFTRHSMAVALGESNLNRVAVASPSADRIGNMLYALCREHCHDGSWGATDTTPLSILDDEDFRVFTGLFLWITCVVAGISGELLVFLGFLRDHGWSEELDIKWKFAQMVFSLLVATSLGLSITHNYMALPLLVVGVFKFGFPEILMYQYMSLRREHGWIERVTDFLNGTGTILHHSAAAMVICMILVGVITPDRHILAPPLILLMQHWFTLLRYINPNLYTVIELVLEFWFEWVVISEFQYIQSNHWTAGIASMSMLVAHWEYLLGAVMGILGDNMGVEQPGVADPSEMKSLTNKNNQGASTSDGKDDLPAVMEELTRDLGSSDGLDDDRPVFPEQSA